MGLMEWKCGKSVGLCALILFFSSVVSHKLGHVEPLPKESIVGIMSHKGGLRSRQSHHLNSTSSSTTSRDGLFGTKIHRNPSLFLHIPKHNGSTRSYLHHHRSPSSSSASSDNDNHMMTMMMREDHKFPLESSEMDTSSSATSSDLIDSPGIGLTGSGRSGGSTTMRGTSMMMTTTRRNNLTDEDSWRSTIRSSDGIYVDNNRNPIDFRNNMMAGFLKREVWTIPLLAIASLNIFLISLFEIYVLCKARGPSRRHLFLGQMLLFALFFCSTLASIFAICPSAVGCFLGRLGLGIAYTLIFSVLMVKCVFLLSLDSGVYLPASYQACLLLFSVLVQVAIDTQWVIVYPPNLQVNQVGGPLWVQCGTSYSQLLLTLSYNVFLIFIVGILAFKTRGIRENYRESTYIGISILVTIPIWMSWTIAGWILQDSKQDACVAFGLLSQSLATFLIMFMPKGRQLAAMGKEGMYLEDQDQDCCSGYSPSFFHFKPSKSYKTALIGDALSNGHFYRQHFNDYNAQYYYPPHSKPPDGNVYTTLEPTISTINPNVFFHRSDPIFHPGMIY